MSKTSSTISGKEAKEIRSVLLKKALTLKENMAKRYREFYEKSSADHVRMMLKTLGENEEKDLELIRDAIGSGSFDDTYDTSDARSFDMLDHLVTQDLEDVNVNDMKSVLLKAMKMSNDIHNIFELMAHEYSQTRVGQVLKTLAVNQLSNKNYIAELYDDFVNKDYW